MVPVAADAGRVGMIADGQPRLGVMSSKPMLEARLQTATLITFLPPTLILTQVDVSGPWGSEPSGLHMVASAMPATIVRAE